jgi:dolichol-phosphate mannosyltransferase
LFWLTLSDGIIKSGRDGMNAAVTGYRQLLSIVVPCYNEQAVLSETLRRMRRVCDTITDLDTEMIFVDDGSQDDTRKMLRTFALSDSRVKYIGFSRNFGHQTAVTAGMDAASGDAVVIIDADLQDPPEIIIEMIKKWREGNDVVYGVRSKRLGESRFKLYTAKLFYRILSKLSDTDIPVDTGDFRLVTRRVADALRDMPEHSRFLRGMVSWVGFRQTPIYYERMERASGVSKYPFAKMLRFAVDGILSFSIRPLRLATTLGLCSTMLAMLGICYALYVRIFTSTWITGWTTLVISVTFFGGVQLLSVGILGEYLGRIYMETKGRPLYIIEESQGIFLRDNANPRKR